MLVNVSWAKKITRSKEVNMTDCFKAGCLPRVAYIMLCKRISAKKITLFRNQRMYLHIYIHLNIPWMDIWFVLSSFSVRIFIWNVISPNQTTLSPVSLKLFFFSVPEGDLGLRSWKYYKLSADLVISSIKTTY